MLSGRHNVGKKQGRRIMQYDSVNREFTNTKVKQHIVEGEIHMWKDDSEG
jgi:hypothetical protein